MAFRLARPRAAPERRGGDRRRFSAVTRNVLVRRQCIYTLLRRSRPSQVARAAEGATRPGEEPDWDREMQLFKERMTSPNQLETLRKIAEDDVDTGRVLYCADGLAIIEGLDEDAAIGTTLQFFSGATGTLVWRRDDLLCYALVVGGAELVQTGEPVSCKVAAIFQVVDSDEGPMTKREFETLLVPAGRELSGRVVDFLGREWTQGASSSNPPSTTVASEQCVPVLNAQPAMDAREPICAGLTTGVKAVDVLAPLGKGQSLLFAGRAGAGKSQAAIDAVVGAARGGARCVYAAVGQSPEEIRLAAADLKAAGVMGQVTVVACESGRPLSEQYASLCTALAVGEAHRDAGGDALVVLDDARCVVELWESMVRAAASLGRDSIGFLVQREGQGGAGATSGGGATTSGAAGGEGGAGEGVGAADSGSGDGASGSGGGESGAGPSDAAGSISAVSKSGSGSDTSPSPATADLVDYEGMLLSAAAAHRRRFFASLLQRSAKMHRRLGGGSLTLVPVLPGVPATGQAQGDKARRAIERMTTLSPEQKSRLLASLDSQASTDPNSNSNDSSTDIATEAIEEFLSITDGQVVWRREGGGTAADPSQSLSRIGARAYAAQALRDRAPSVRLAMVQGEDEGRYGVASADAGRESAAGVRRSSRARVTRSLLWHERGRVASVEEEVCMLHAIQRGMLDAVSEDDAPRTWAKAWASLRAKCGHALEELRATGVLTARAEAEVEACLQAALAGAGAVA